MGQKFMDQFSLLHFAVGVIAQFWGVDLGWFIVIHTIFEALENTEYVMRFTRHFHYWPGGKPLADSFLNMVGDTFFSILGWVCAYCIQAIGEKNNWTVVKRKKT